MEKRQEEGEREENTLQDIVKLFANVSAHNKWTSLLPARCPLPVRPFAILPVRPAFCPSDCHSLTVMGALHCDWHGPPCEWSNLDAHRLHNYHFIKNVFGLRCK